MSPPVQSRSWSPADDQAPTALFDRHRRIDDYPAKLGETMFAFLNRVNDPYFAQVRAVLNRWYRSTPEPERKRLYGSLRSRDDRQGHAAFWELYLLVALKKVGLELDSHPSVSGSSRRPDWLVHPPTGGTFYLEATSLSISDEDIKRHRVWSQVRDALNQIQAPDFWLAIDNVDDSSSAPPGPARLARDVERWIAATDYAQVVNRGTAATHAPTRRFEYPTGWAITISLYPKSRAGRGDPSHRAIGFDRGGWIFPDDPQRLRRLIRSLDAKARAYGTALDRPLVLAMTDLSDWPLEPEYIRRAFYEGVPGVRPFWTHRRNHHVAAVITSNNLRPWSLTTVLPTVWYRPGLPELLPLPWNVASEAATRLSVSSGADLLDLPTPWPVGQPFRRRMRQQSRYRRIREQSQKS